MLPDITKYPLGLPSSHWEVLPHLNLSFCSGSLSHPRELSLAALLYLPCCLSVLRLLLPCLCSFIHLQKPFKPKHSVTSGLSPPGMLESERPHIVISLTFHAEHASLACWTLKGHLRYTLAQGERKEACGCLFWDSRVCVCCFRAQLGVSSTSCPQPPSHEPFPASRSEPSPSFTVCTFMTIVLILGLALLQIPLV
jgi:hypothetical protein